MAVFGKRSGGSGVLEAPEETYAQSEWKTPEPAPAGMLQRRGRVEATEPPLPEESEEIPYRAKRDSLRYKLSIAFPKSVAGKIVGGALLLMLLGAVVGSMLALRSMLLHDARFAVATSAAIQVQGTEHLPREQVMHVFGGDLERNIFKVPLAERRAELEKIPWVKKATVMRLLPNTVRIEVTERTPVAFARTGSDIGLVDADGVLLKMPQDIAGDPKYSFPVLTGLSASDPASVRKARMEIYQKFMTALDSGAKPGSARPSESISEIDLSNPDDVKAIVNSGGDVLVHFGEEKFLKRYQMFEQNLPAWRAQYPRLASVDTRYDNQFVLAMEPGAQVPLNATAAAQAGAASSAPAGTAAPVAKAALAKAAAAKPVAVKHAAVKSVAVKSPHSEKPVAVASRHEVKAPAKAVKSAKTARPAMPTMSKQQIQAMLAAARSKPSANGGR